MRQAQEGVSKKTENTPACFQHGLHRQQRGTAYMYSDRPSRGNSGRREGALRELGGVDRGTVLFYTLGI